MGRRVVAIGAALSAGLAGLGFALVSVVTVVTGATAASASTTHLVEDGVPSYTSDSVGIIDNAHNKLTWSGTFTDSAGHQDGTFTATFTGPASGSQSTSDPKPSPCTAGQTAGDLCTYNSRDGALTFTPDIVKVGGTITARMVSPAGVGNSWNWPDLAGLTRRTALPLP